jgi:hypothetical protein
MAGSVGLLLTFTAVIAQGTDIPAWQTVAFVGILVCLVASYVVGLVAALRMHERSWVVLVPTALISAVIAMELIQGVLQLAGFGD